MGSTQGNVLPETICDNESDNPSSLSPNLSEISKDDRNCIDECDEDDPELFARQLMGLNYKVFEDESANKPQKDQGKSQTNLIDTSEKIKVLHPMSISDSKRNAPSDGLNDATFRNEEPKSSMQSLSSSDSTIRTLLGHTATPPPILEKWAERVANELTPTTPPPFVNEETVESNGEDLDIEVLEDDSLSNGTDFDAFEAVAGSRDNNENIFGKRNILDGPDVIVDLRGTRYRVPSSIQCHLCEDRMRLCIRRTKYRGETREYPSYRCNRKGCQTFRSIRKVFQSSWLREKDMIKVDPVRVMPSAASVSLKHHFRPAFRRRAPTFDEFNTQLKQDIIANRQSLIAAQKASSQNVIDMTLPVKDQGTLLYLAKELTAREIMEVQNAVINIMMRKKPESISIFDLPLFSHCPVPLSQLQKGLQTTGGVNKFANAFARSPQPPLPNGIVVDENDQVQRVSQKRTPSISKSIDLQSRDSFATTSSEASSSINSCSSLFKTFKHFSRDNSDLVNPGRASSVITRKRPAPDRRGSTEKIFQSLFGSAEKTPSPKRHRVHSLCSTQNVPTTRGKLSKTALADEYMLKKQMERMSSSADKIPSTVAAIGCKSASRQLYTPPCFTTMKTSVLPNVYPTNNFPINYNLTPTMSQMFPLPSDGLKQPNLVAQSNGENKPTTSTPPSYENTLNSFNMMPPTPILAPAANWLAWQTDFNNDNSSTASTPSISFNTGSEHDPIVDKNLKFDPPVLDDDDNVT